MIQFNLKHKYTFFVVIYCGLSFLLAIGVRAQKIVICKPNYINHPLQQWERKFSNFQFEALKMKGHTLPFRIYKPLNIISGKQYPLVFFMHGYGERGNDDRKQFLRFPTVEFWSKYPCFIVAPQCPERASRDESTWVKTNFGAPYSKMNKQPTWPMELAMKLLDKIIAENPIDQKKIYITGLSMGGFATWEFLQREPKKFAAAMPLSGGADTSFANKMVHIPIWVFHGSADKTVMPKRSIDMVRAIRAAGGKPEFTEYSGVGHDTWTRTYSNPKVWDWLFAQQKQ